MRCALSLHKLAPAVRILTVAIVGALMFADDHAHAQVRDVEPYHVVVTGERVYLRCGAGGVWYAIGYADTGDVLRVDGEDFKWARVRYPDDAPALVSVEEADYFRDRGVVVITRPSRLKAHNIHGQRFGDSWKNLLMRPLDPGTELRHIDTLRDANGQVEGYLVEAPAGARAFISDQYTRRATPSEITAWRAAQRAATETAEKPQSAESQARPVAERPTSDAPTPATTTAQRGRTPEPTVTETDRATSSRDERAAPTTTENEPVTTVADDEAPSAAPTEDAPSPREVVRRDPASTPAPTERPVARPEQIEARRPATTESSPIQTPEPTTTTAETPSDEEPTVSDAEAPAAPSFEQLEAAFIALAEQPTEDAEIEPLIAEYRRFRTTINDTEANQAWLRRVDNRIAILEVRRELQANLLALNEASAEAGADAEAMRARLAQLDRSRPYTLVGRLTASALYDGKRLPLMYRLQSVDAGGGRTIAYLVPNEDIDLRGRLGSIVGVEGQSRIDPALKLRIVQPSRVDLLTPTLTRVTEPDQP